MSAILKSKLKVALIQLAGSAPDKNANLTRAATFVAKAMKEQPDTKLVVLPECFNSPYAVDKFREYAEVITPEAPSVKALSEIARQWKIILVGGSIPELEPTSDKLYNTSIIFNEKGELIGTHRKAHLFDVDIPNGITFKESTTLSAGNKNTLIDEPSIGKFGVGICYDLRFPELAMVNARKGAFAMIYPSAFNTVTGPMHWHLLARSRSIDNEIYTLLCSPARNLNSSYHAYGHSLVVNPKGEVIAEAGEGEEIIYAELDPEFIKEVRQAIPVTFQRRFDIYGDVSKFEV
ncbi:probable hydrolase NIT3 [Kluyveromyces marxianus]|uniref:Hydrolase NIT3 n=2 Tax=Kluyveromyces marxianus TaxID=4911 RepID=A0ABX6ETI8_KLUMA|nr:probable hydrolase NIT3 [Kluyveromyces marxianus DMKU3-1042]QGN15649.1 putative hydrolase NIT3 [Kluyveromyces marxianus]BAO39936.1 probable hydrolase NIT3 [Kluyveromyces marxianus DMKU3-1042]BAP71417.1 probable hydrolase NIT3 [Kluyveromyces marxianus]